MPGSPPPHWMPAHTSRWWKQRHGSGTRRPVQSRASAVHRRAALAYRGQPACGDLPPRRLDSATHERMVTSLRAKLSAIEKDLNLNRSNNIRDATRVRRRLLRRTRRDGCSPFLAPFPPRARSLAEVLLGARRRAAGRRRRGRCGGGGAITGSAMMQAMPCACFTCHPPAEAIKSISAAREFAASTKQVAESNLAISELALANMQYGVASFHLSRVELGTEAVTPCVLPQWRESRSRMPAPLRTCRLPPPQRAACPAEHLLRSTGDVGGLIRSSGEGVPRRPRYHRRLLCHRRPRE